MAGAMVGSAGGEAATSSVDGMALGLNAGDALALEAAEPEAGDDDFSIRA